MLNIVKEDVIPIDFKADLFSLIKKDEERRNNLYHGLFIFNNKIYDENIKVVGKLKGE
jgi:hypothetical protein